MHAHAPSPPLPPPEVERSAREKLLAELRAAELDRRRELDTLQHSHEEALGKARTLATSEAAVRQRALHSSLLAAQQLIGRALAEHPVEHP